MGSIKISPIRPIFTTSVIDKKWHEIERVKFVGRGHVQLRNAGAREWQTPPFTTLETHLNDGSAIRSARRMSLGRQFEVWRDSECITGAATTFSPVAERAEQVPF
jgi:hypothetical protein